MSEWQSFRYLADHFEKHGRSVGARCAEEYDASARALLARDGTVTFSYEDATTYEIRVGV